MAFKPLMAGTILMQHHARHRAAWPPPPVRAAARRLGHQPTAVEKVLRPGVAPAEAMVGFEVLVKMLGGEALIALAIEPLHFLSLTIRQRPSRSPPQAAIGEPVFALLLKSPRPSPERPLAHAQYLCRLQLAQPSGFPATQHIPELQHPQSL